MRTSFLLFIILAATGNFGCSKIQDQLRVRVDLFKAEQIYWKTFKLKDRKVPFEERQVYYRKACDLFLKTLDAAPGLFNAARFEEAGDCCFNAENADATRRLEELNEAYCKNHPKECEYGFIDAGGEF